MSRENRFLKVVALATGLSLVPGDTVDKPPTSHTTKVPENVLPPDKEKGVLAEFDRETLQMALFKMKEMMLAYFEKHKQYQETFWLEGNESEAEARQKVASWHENFRSLLSKYADTNGMTKEIFTAFPDTRAILPSDEIAPTGLSIRVMPEHSNVQEPFDFMYKGGSQGFVVATANNRHSLQLAGTIYHELGHAWYARRHPERKGPDGSDAHYVEEMTMHGVEGAVFDKATDGATTRLFDKIMGRSIGKTPSIKDVLGSLTVADLVAYDTLLGETQASVRVAGATSVGFMAELGERFIEKYVPQNEQDQARSVFYRYTIAMEK